MTGDSKLYLLYGVFSLRWGNMRFPNLRRLLAVLIALPLFIVLLIVNNIFLFLDRILFAEFRDLPLKNPVFIIAAPRSGTTHLFHNLSSKTDRFTTIKLWEIILAPSILQKYIILAFNWLDSKIGHPLKKLVKMFDRFIFRKISGIHPISLFQPEEDEALLLWNLESIYLNFFYPDSYFFDDQFAFDEKISGHIRSNKMRRYRRYLQRHDYVFNRSGKKQVLSKNPLMMCKVQSLSFAFPDALILNINRCPSKVIPSSIALNNLLYGLFTSIPASDYVNERTTDVLINWYKLCEQGLNDSFPDRHLKISFDQMVRNNPEELERISNFLNIEIGELGVESGKNKKRNEYKELSPKEKTKLLEQIPFMKSYCQ